MDTLISTLYIQIYSPHLKEYSTRVGISLYATISCYYMNNNTIDKFNSKELDQVVE